MLSSLKSVKFLKNSVNKVVFDNPSCRYASIKYNSNNMESRENFTRNLKEDCTSIFLNSVNAVLPANMINKVLHVHQNKLSIAGKVYPLNKNVYIVAAGKAVIGMVRSVEDLIHDHIVRGVASVPKGIGKSLSEAGKQNMLPNENSKIEVYEGAENNIPDLAAMEASKKIHELASSLKESDIMLVLLSGGGSALLPYPKPPITVEEMQALLKTMVQHAATIQELNTVRKHTEILKGGGLAYAANNAQIVSLILSDVIGDPIDKIASGPTVTDLSTPQQCMRIFEQLNVVDKIPQSVLQVVEEANREFTWKKSLPVIEQIYSHNVIVGNNKMAVEAAVQTAEAKGFLTFVLSTTMSGESKNIGYLFAMLTKFLCGVMGNTSSSQVRDLVMDELELVKYGIPKKSINELLKLATSAVTLNKPLCIIGAGETVVTLKGTGIGGRCLELAMSTATHLYKYSQELSNYQVQFLAAGTDGQDANTGAAGAFCDKNTIIEGKLAQLDANRYLSNNDSYSYFEKLNNKQNLLYTGFTGTNVMDLYTLIISKST